MLTVVMPFYRKDLEFNFVFSNYNIHMFNQHPNLELLIIVDDPNHYESTVSLLEQLKRTRSIQFSIKVFLNANEHAWRPPCIAINVGIYNARYDKILVISPETILLNNSLQQLMNSCSEERFSIGVIQFFTTSSFDYQPITDIITATHLKKAVPYGSVMFTKKQAERIGGYNEEFSVWGGDDDDFRYRLKQAGFVQRITLARFIHVQLQRHTINGSLNKEKELQFETLNNKINSMRSSNNLVANNGIYGRAFDHIIFSHNSCTSISDTCTA